MRRLLGALIAAVLCGSQTFADPVILTADQMRAFGSEALLRGYADQALEVAEALLLRDPGDSQAWTLKAQALRLGGDLPGSEAAARQAWATAKDDATRYAAATAVAQALSLQNHRTAAQFWLRQATENAPNAGARAQALQDFNYVRGQNPLRLQVQASLRPSNNVNGGTREKSFYVPIFGGLELPYLPDDRALSGQVWSLGLSGSYKLRDTGHVQDALTFSFSQQGARLAAKSKAAAPYLSDSDFTYALVEGGYERKLAFPGSLVTMDLTAGHSWYGGAPLANALSGQVSLNTNVTAKVTGSFTVSMNRQIRLDRPISSSTEVGAQAQLGRTGPKGDHWQLGMDLSETFSQDRGIGNAAATLTLGWQADKPILGLDLGASVAVRAADFVNGRHDTRIALGLNAAVEKLSYLGFSPVLSLDAARNTSTNSRFSTDTVGIGLSLKSNF